MTRATILTLLRRQLMEETPRNWDDAVLHDLINQGYHFAQKEIMKVDPEAFLEFVQRDLTVGVSYYARPDGDWFPNQVRVKDSTTGKYSPITWKPFDLAEEWTGESYVWARRGAYICIFPAPSTTIAAGLELIHVPTLTLAVDTDVPKIPLGIHLAIVYLAKVTALGETYQNYDRDVVMIEKILGDIGSYYSPTGGQPLSWRPQVVKPVGYAG